MMEKIVFMALRNVTRNRRRSAIALGAIGFAVCVVTLLVALSKGFIDLSISNVVKTRNGALQIHRTGYLASTGGSPLSYRFPLNQPWLKTLEGLEDLNGVAPRLQFSGLLGNGAHQTLVFATAIDPPKESVVCPLAATLLGPGGTLLTSSSQPHIQVGALLATALHLDIGSTPTLSVTGPSGRKNALDLTLIGAVRSAIPVEEQRSAVVPLSVAQTLLGIPGEVTELALGVPNLKNLDAVKSQVQDVVGPQFEVHTWMELQPFIRDILFRQKVLISIVTVTLVVLAVFLIANTMLMCVFERVREIGTMMALGLGRRHIKSLFLVESLFLGTLGALGGLLVSGGLVAYFQWKGIALPTTSGGGDATLRPTLDIWFFPLVVLATSVFSMLAGLYPAQRASQLKPVEALAAQ